MSPPGGLPGMIHCPTCAGVKFEIDPGDSKTPAKFHCKKCRLVSGQADLLISIGSTTDLIKRFNHVIRAAIMVHLLAQGEMSPSMIAKAIHEEIPTVAYHIRVLKDCGAVEGTKEVPVRGAVEHFYVAVPIGE